MPSSTWAEEEEAAVRKPALMASIDRTEIVTTNLMALLVKLPDAIHVDFHSFDHMLCYVLLFVIRYLCFFIDSCRRLLAKIWK